MKPARLFVIALLMLLPLSAFCGPKEGMASYYADALHGNPTASGEAYDKEALTAAHRTLPFGTQVKVTNLDNGKTVVVRINDRGPHVESRLIDVSGAAARKLEMTDSGTAQVRLEVEN